MRSRLFRGLFIVALVLFSASVLAQESGAFKSALDDIKKDVEKAVNIKTGDSAFGARKQVLLKILNFTDLEIKDLHGRVSAVGAPSGAEAALQSQFISKLWNFSRQLDIFRSVIQNVRTVDEIKAFASSLKGWRENYLGEATKIKDWLLYIQVVSVFQRAADRYSMVQKEVANLGDATNNKDNSSILSAISKAGDALGEAELLLGRAQSVILSFYLDTDHDRSPQKNFIEPSDLIMQALSKIKEIYLSFLELSFLISRNG